MTTDLYHLAMEEHHRTTLGGKLDQLRRAEISLDFFNAEEVRFFAECNRVNSEGYAAVSTEMIEAYLTERDRRIRRYISTLKHG